MRVRTIARTFARLTPPPIQTGVSHSANALKRVSTGSREIIHGLFGPSFLWTIVIIALVGIVSMVSFIWLAKASSRDSIGSLARLGFHGQVPDFSLIERNGQPVSSADLRGKAWIVNFIYTRCTEECPLETARMAQLQADLHDADLHFVSVSVDPEYDTPVVLSEYAARFGAHPDRWLFLTGANDAIQRLVVEGFRLGLFENPREEVHIHSDGSTHIHHTPIGQAIAHSSRFVLVDQDQRIRGYYPSDDEGSLQRVRRDVKTVIVEKRTSLPLTTLPTINAVLNATSAALLGIGYFFIRRRMIAAHRICMIAAVAASALFLLSYLTYHYFAGSIPFSGRGWTRVVYFAVLIPHTILAAILLPFVVVVLRRGLMRNDRKHQWLAQRVLPLWFYTSVTGIIVYVMLYHLF